MIKYLKFSISFILLLSLLSHAETTVQDFKDYSESEDIVNGLPYPLSQYTTRENLQEINRQIMSKKIAQQVMVVDTRNQTECFKVYLRLKKMGWPVESSLCDQDNNNPFVSVNMVSEVPAESERDFKPIIIHRPDFFKPSNENQKQLLERTRNIALLSMAPIIAFATMPEAQSGWDKKGVKENGVFHQMREHYQNGPVKDHDNDFINYVLHPVAGSLYYQAARLSGYGHMQSFGYSVLMSTFFWEYGVESMFETPSLNDLIVTPVLGSLLGEVFLKFYEHIEDNKGKLFGSKKLGFIGKILVNSPEALRPYINSIFKSDFIKSGSMSISAQKCSPYSVQSNSGNPLDFKFDEYCPFLTFSFKFGGGPKK